MNKGEKDIKTYMPKQVIGNGEFDLNDIIYSNRVTGL